MSNHSFAKRLAYRPDIDGLRALAVCIVILYHAFPDTFPGGFIGVDIFFVISGFLITALIYSECSTNTFSLLDFYIRRIKRIFPALLIVLIFCFVFGWFNLLADEYKQLGKHIAASALFVSNLLLWSESNYFDVASYQKPLLHLWSLGVEEQFYVIWPVLIWSAIKRNLHLLYLSLAILLSSFIFSIYETQNTENLASAFYLPQSRFWELMVGALLAYLLFHPSKALEKFKAQPGMEVGRGSFVFSNTSKTKDLLSFLGILSVGLGMALIDKNTRFPGYWALLPVIGAALIVLAGPKAWVNKYLLSNPLMVWVGLISYPLYLWHWPLLSFAQIITGDMPSVPTRIFIVIGSFALAFLTYYFIEKPLRFGGRAKFKTLCLIFLMLVIGYVGFNTYDRDGLTFRLNQIQFRLPETLQSLRISQTEKSNIFRDKTLVGESNKPKIILWGDSYAGHLVVGYEERYSKVYEIVQLNTGGCPPILNMHLPNRKNCIDLNQENFDRVVAENPKKLVLAANWTDYDWEKVGPTIDRLQQAGLKSIDLVGPAPQWKDSLYKQLYFHYLKNRDPNIPYRMQFGLNANFLEIEPRLRELADKKGVRYISIVAILCNEAGCITRFGDTGDKLASFDGGHFTNYASRFVVSQFPRPD
jgi:peptidoglycan/LPS O-acetylase OafA/YrhL